MGHGHDEPAQDAPRHGGHQGAARAAGIPLHKAHGHGAHDQGAHHVPQGVPRQRTRVGEEQGVGEGDEGVGPQGGPLLVGGGDHEGPKQQRRHPTLKEGEAPYYDELQPQQQAQPAHGAGRKGRLPLKEQQIQAENQIDGQQIQQIPAVGPAGIVGPDHAQGHEMDHVPLRQGRPRPKDDVPLLHGHGDHLVGGGGAGQLRLHLVHHGGDGEKLVDEMPGQLRLADGRQGRLLELLLGPVSGGLQLTFLHAPFHARQDGV